MNGLKLNKTIEKQNVLFPLTDLAPSERDRDANRWTDGLADKHERWDSERRPCGSGREDTHIVPLPAHCTHCTEESMWMGRGRGEMNFTLRIRHWTNEIGH